MNRQTTRFDLFAAAGEWGCDGAFDALWNEVDKIDGWLSVGQARVLLRAATQVPDGHWIVEIGSHKGRSTVCLASGITAGARMLAVDPFDNPRWGGGPQALSDFHHTLDQFGLAGTVDTYRGVSREASVEWNGKPIAVLFIDGAHDEASVLADIDGWERYLAPAGIVLVHDAFSSIGVTLALTRRHVMNRSYQYLGADRTLVGFTRRDLSRWQAVVSGCSLTMRYGYFVRNAAVKILLRQGKADLARRALRFRAGDDLF